MIPQSVTWPLRTALNQADQTGSGESYARQPVHGLRAQTAVAGLGQRRSPEVFFFDNCGSHHRGYRNAHHDKRNEAYLKHTPT